MSEIATHVAVHHPKTGGDWQCPVGYLDAAREDGWEVVTDEQVAASAYDGQTNAQLAEEIGRRNADPVDPGVEPLAATGNKSELLATLIADDARRANAGSNS